MSISQIKMEPGGNADAEIKCENVQEVWIETKIEQVKEEPLDDVKEIKLENNDPDESYLTDASFKVELCRTKNALKDNVGNGVHESLAVHAKRFEKLDSTGVDVQGILNDDIDVKTYKCEQCNKTYARDGDLRRHLNTSSVHTAGVNLTCDKCNKSFSTFKHLRDHTIWNHNGYTFNTIVSKVPDSKIDHHCNHCNKIFKTKDSLSKHVMYSTMHAPVEKIHSCDKCLFSFTLLSALENHKKENHRNPESSKASIISTVYQNRVVCGKIVQVKAPIKKVALKNIYMRTGSKSKKDIHDNRSKQSSTIQNIFKDIQDKEIDLQERYESTTKNKSFECAQCKTTYRREADLNKHLTYSAIHNGKLMQSKITHKNITKLEH